MISWLDVIGPAIWRASWQATVLAFIVVVILRVLGERLSPRWRFLIWSVVLTRMLFVVTPVSPLSAYNLVQWKSEVGVRSIARREPNQTFSLTPNNSDTVMIRSERTDESPQINTVAPVSASAQTGLLERGPSMTSGIPEELKQSSFGRFDAVAIGRALSLIWIAGCLLLSLKLLTTAYILRQRLSVSRRVTDGNILELLETTRRRIGLERTPTLLVTPEPLNPCVVGTWQPRIVLPESLVTGSTLRLQHVLAHELAHLMRRDLWTNWLLLTARIVHWFNPVAWLTVREMQAEREAACDELAFAALGEPDRSAYASTIVEVAASLTPSAIAPGLIGFFSSTCRLKARVERLMQSPSVPRLATPLACGLLFGLVFVGLTDSIPDAGAQPPKEKEKEAVTTEIADPNANKCTISGSCIHHPDRKPMAGVTVRLFRFAGRTSPPTEIAKKISDTDGRFEFRGLDLPGPDDYLGQMMYTAFGFADGWPIGLNFRRIHGREQAMEIWMTRETSTLSGIVVDAEGRPVDGAMVQRHSTDGRLIDGLPTAKTDAKGRFKFDNVPVYKMPDGKPWNTLFSVIHPNYPVTSSEAGTLPADVVVKLPGSCIVTGTVANAITKQPAAGVMITAERIDVWKTTYTVSDAEGNFRLAVTEGQYNFLAAAPDKVCVALTGRECLADAKIELPVFSLIDGGLISGQVVNTATGESVAVSERGEPIMIGLYGPSMPMGPVISPTRFAEVDKAGRFTLRAAPGENFPYLVNTRGVRMAWDTCEKPPVVVKEGETTSYNMLITPEVPPIERLKAARKLVENLSEDKFDRVAQILLEFKKLNHTVDETELWCTLMRELVAIGADAVPQLCAELDQTIENRMMRRLGFALRAIGDARAVPALIRAIPKTLLPSSSDYGLIVEDKELTDFMQKSDLDEKAGGAYFSLGRPEREIIGALHKLTGQKFDDGDVEGISLSEDPRRQILQRRIYGKLARHWQTWWEATWQSFTNDAAYKKVTLIVDDEQLPPAPQLFAPTSRVVGELSGAVLSPAREAGQHVWHFYDLDTGYRPKWPKQIPKGEGLPDAKQLADWASQCGADLMCVTYRSPDGKETYVLRALGMKVREINTRELRNLDKIIAGGQLPEGRPVGELLMHFDPKSQQLVPDANAAFIYTTREGSIGVIETTDRVTRTADLTGQPAGQSPGVGFHVGVRFDLKAIIP